MSKLQVSPQHLDKATMTEDGNAACRYSLVWQVIVHTPKWDDAYYFVHEHNADKFIAQLYDKT